MKYPKIDVQSHYSKEYLRDWTISESDKYAPRESRAVNAILLPIAKRETTSSMVVEALRQIENFQDYKRILAVGCCTANINSGIYFLKDRYYSNDLVSIDASIDDTIIQKLEKLDIVTCTDATYLLESSELFYNLPLIAQMTQEKLPIIPIIYHNADESDLNKIFEVFSQDDTLILICSDLSHSLSDAEIKSLDSVTISKIIALDNTVTNNQCTAYTAVNCLIHLSDVHFWRPRLLRYQSTGFECHVINTSGFATVIFYE